MLVGIQASTYFKEDGMSCRCVSDLSTGLLDTPKNDPSPRLYPNPATDQVCLSGAGIQPTTIRVLDALGRCMVQQQTVAGNTCVELAALAPGIYSVLLVGQGSEVRRSLVKE